jgi:hypothetical protein
MLKVTQRKVEGKPVMTFPDAGLEGVVMQITGAGKTVKKTMEAMAIIAQLKRGEKVTTQSLILEITE